MNPIIRHTFTADPTVLEHEGKVYLFTGHDEPPAGTDDYVMKKWLCFSSDDLSNWTEHPSPLKATDFHWASGDAFASKVIRLNGAFYWFAAVSHRDIPGKAIGLAKSPLLKAPIPTRSANRLFPAICCPNSITIRKTSTPRCYLLMARSTSFGGTRFAILRN